ncbi:MAG: hypothetical protein NTY77_11165 [Elusimicrobia bacterium]|nr:hypothetical protein [Elusimicrobiota bacterium]
MTLRAPHLEFLRRLRAEKIDFLLVGALAVGHYAPELSQTYSTYDCDVLVRPDLEHFRKAVRTLARCGFQLQVGGEPLVKPDALVFKRLLGFRTTVCGERPDALSVELLLEAKGFSFAEWWQTRREFRVAGFRIACGALENLVASKKASARPKDKAFLKLYEAAFTALPRKRARRAKR